MRTEKELWQLVLSRQNLFKLGLCLWVNEVYFKGEILKSEFDYLRMVLDNNLPVKDSWGWCWELGKIQPRIDWINERIKQIENETR